jgi:hypothetical protein
MLRFLTIEQQKTMFGRSLFAAKLFFFFFTALVSAKDEYEQYFLLNRKKKCRMYGENFFSVYVSRLDR